MSCGYIRKFYSNRFFLAVVDPFQRIEVKAKSSWTDAI